MAVSKRLRYEVLRRDNHACRYCGATAPSVNLNVDHVIPQALGGSDKPDNLVTACADCNAGKTSSMPNAMPVADVDQGAFRRASDLQQAEKQRRNAISLHLYMVWIWAYEKTGHTPNDANRRWFIEETYHLLACGYSAHIDLTEPAYRAGLANDLGIQSYIKLPDAAASPEAERFVNTVVAVEEWKRAWDGAAEIRDPYLREVEALVRAVHNALDAGRAICDINSAAERAGDHLSPDLDRFLLEITSKGGVN